LWPLRSNGIPRHACFIRAAWFIRGDDPEAIVPLQTRVDHVTGRRRLAVLAVTANRSDRRREQRNRHD
jgi:hypothetical protein